ncbi:alpha/beta hydrolase [Mucilaginibacter aquatilis]|uniref:Alpha/beta hydrolase fold domain-containing protein n=1 Tax=Mucilaginibacter aquatilis TaxID=1517760 RepID=A0A6I4IGD6_9SPHI|nr:alpha/beta hydrolase [Mucilaginibacter aquatilis]MVN92606.1 alpha/beta hydrolase fold domain-containing protein [Mucilaginibacter aquatilis]
MYRLIVTVCLILVAKGGFCQFMQGLTHKPDTSFSNNSAYRNAVKKYPAIKLAPDSLPEDVEAIKNISYSTVNKQLLLLDVFAPKRQQKRLPAIIIIHGGGWRSGNRTQHYALAQQLARQGFVCFTPAYHLSTDALYPAAVNDLKAAIAWVKSHAKKYNVDAKKLSVLGFSAGGQLATLLGTTEKNLMAIVDIDGTLALIHPESGEGDDSKSISAATYWFGYNKTQRPDLWKEAAALTHVGPLTPPTLFINSSVDRMHAGRTDYIDTLNKYKIYSEVHTFPDSPHTFCLFEPWFTPTVKYITSFLNKLHLKIKICNNL